MYVFFGGNIELGGDDEPDLFGVDDQEDVEAFIGRLQKELYEVNEGRVFVSTIFFTDDAWSPPVPPDPPDPVDTGDTIDPGDSTGCETPPPHPLLSYVFARKGYIASEIGVDPVEFFPFLADVDTLTRGTFLDESSNIATVLVDADDVIQFKQVDSLPNIDRLNLMIQALQ